MFSRKGHQRIQDTLGRCVIELDELIDGLCKLNPARAVTDVTRTRLPGLSVLFIKASIWIQAIGALMDHVNNDGKVNM